METVWVNYDDEPHFAEYWYSEDKYCLYHGKPDNQSGSFMLISIERFNQLEQCEPPVFSINDRAIYTGNRKVEVSTPVTIIDTSISRYTYGIKDTYGKYSIATPYELQKIDL